ncbi:hypothetical protein [Lactobacillus crispatus]|uniref:hypothetical protein n=1 Tax=Lactobacillus crispatus TaxID=47770 RepID=UPI001ABE29F5|nr:hypothetical protein [Lactobacillus crispatus]MBO4165920.1 hypothetical protein [Lactobacillus crispatus]
MTAEINTLSLDELEKIREKLFQLGLLTRDADLSNKIYEVIDLVEKKMEAKKHARTNQSYGSK